MNSSPLYLSYTDISPKTKARITNIVDITGFLNDNLQSVQPSVKRRDYVLVLISTKH